MMVIRKKNSLSSQMYHVAVAALGMTVAWASRFFLYIDKTYQTYSVGKFGPAKSWHITTKLATALLLEMSKPREGMFDTLESGADNNFFNARVVFYNTLKPLDVMQNILDNNFKDHLAVSQELVKFLSLNTSVEENDSLTKKMSLMESKTHQMEGDLKSVQKSLPR